MPLHKRHSEQRSKNWFLLAILLLFIAIVYGLTLIKLGG